MHEYTSHKPGTFCWCDLYTTDAASAKKFYSEILGLTTRDIPYGNDYVYTFLLLNNKPVAGIGPMVDEQRNQNIAPYWMPYVSSDNADKLVNRAREFGGKIITEPMAIENEGRMALIKDPDGAVVGIWEPKDHIGASYKLIPGSLCWTEHGSHDPDKATRFLSNVFGWKAFPQVIGGQKYTVFQLDDERICGLYTIPKGMKDSYSNWMIHFEVEDIDDTISKCRKLGGSVIMEKTFAQSAGYFGVLQDPQGAIFGIHKLAEQP